MHLTTSIKLGTAATQGLASQRSLDAQRSGEPAPCALLCCEVVAWVCCAEDDIAAALEVQKLSADKPMELLSQDPDRFFGRTTQVSRGWAWVVGGGLRGQCAPGPGTRFASRHQPVGIGTLRARVAGYDVAPLL